MIEVLIEADDRLTMLPRQGGDPDVILRYRATFLAQFLSNARIGAGSRLVDEEDSGFADQMVEQARQSATVAGSDQSEPVLPDDHHR